MPAMILPADTATTATAPWYYVALLAGALTFFATVFSALMTLLSVALSDRRSKARETAKINREESRVDKRDLRAAMGRFLVETRDSRHAFKAMWEVQIPKEAGVAAWYKPKPDIRPLNLRAVYQAYWELVTLPTTDATINEAARVFLESTRDFDRADVVLGLEPAVLPANQYEELNEKYFVARSAFVKAVMSQLGVEGLAYTVC